MTAHCNALRELEIGSAVANVPTAEINRLPFDSFSRERLELGRRWQPTDAMLSYFLNEFQWDPREHQVFFCLVYQLHKCSGSWGLHPSSGTFLILVVILVTVSIELFPLFRATDIKVYSVQQGFRDVLGLKRGVEVLISFVYNKQILFCLKNLDSKPVWEMLRLSVLPENHLKLRWRDCISVITPILSLLWRRASRPAQVSASSKCDIKKGQQNHCLCWSPPHCAESGLEDLFPYPQKEEWCKASGREGIP